MTKRLRFHFPLYYIKENKLCGTDYYNARAELIRRWSALCEEGFNSYKTRLFIRGFECDEELFVIYCDGEIHTEFAKVFVDVTSKYHSQLCQDCYIYEVDDVHVKVYIGEGYHESFNGI